MPHEAKKYKERLGKKVKDMTAEEKREYGRLRVKDHREKKKSAKVAPKPAPKPKKKIKLMKPKEPEPKKPKKIKMDAKQFEKSYAKTASKDGKIPNSKMKCFMRTAQNGKPYRTCAVPEKNKKPKAQVRGKPRPASERKLPYVSAYKNKFHRGNAQKKRDKDKKKK